MTHRRTVLLSSVALAASTLARSQPGGKPYRVGVLSAVGSARRDPIWEAFTAELARLGYVEGRQVLFEMRQGSQDFAGLEAQSTELVALKVDLIFVAAGTPGVRAAMKATKTIPIVMFSTAEPVRDGLVASLAHPGGNVTGNSNVGVELLAKRLQLIAEVVGKPSRIAFLGSRSFQTFVSFDEYRDALAVAARSLGAQLLPARIESLDELDATLEQFVRQRAEALVIAGPANFYPHRQRIADAVARYRLPAIADGRGYADAGVLMSYAVDYADLARKSAAYVDRILKGANPGDLPVEQASKFEMVINLKAAKSLGLTIPTAVLLRADERIE